MEAQQLSNGNLIVPTAVWDPKDQSSRGVAFIEVDPNHEAYKAWMDYYKQQKRKPPKAEPQPVPQATGGKPSKDETDRFNRQGKSLIVPQF